MNILLVDDEPLLLAALDDAIAQVLPDANRFCFSKAREALEFAAETPVDIAFLDINMRVMDGITMAQKLQAQYPRINLIFCTGYPDYALDALNMHCSGYILKPISVRKLEEVVRHLRYPVEQMTPAVRFECGDSFEPFCHNEPIRFRYQKTKDMLAILAERNGITCTMRELSTLLFQDQEHRSYMNQLRRDLLDAFADLGQENVIFHTRGTLALNRNAVQLVFPNREHA